MMIVFLFFVAIAAAYRSTQCPYVFIIANGVNTSMSIKEREPGITLYRNLSYADPWIDTSGYGTILHDNLKEVFTSCVKIFPIKTEQNEINFTLFNTFTLSRCEIELREHDCLILSPWKLQPNITSLPVLNNVHHMYHWLSK